jgi:hypothetical protein
MILITLTWAGGQGKGDLKLTYYPKGWLDLVRYKDIFVLLFDES